MPTTVIPAVVPDPSRFASWAPSEARSRFGLPQDEPVVGYVGRLDDEKGIKDLLLAMGSLGPSAPFLSVWGAGRLEGLVRHHLVGGQVRGSFGGALGLGEVPEALRACDVVVVPSRTTPGWREQFGRVIVEAMLAGAAVVAYRSGAIPEAAGDGALLVDEGDVSGLAAAIRRLMNDSAFRSELAARGREEALSRFHPRVLAERLVRFWSEVLSR
jgi:glycosyltransferase involved in cell wall biosynthesis